MATITLTFTPPGTPPSNGYKVTYREVGTSTYNLVTPNQTTSPITITGLPAGKNWEGKIQSICDGDGLTSTEVGWNVYTCIAASFTSVTLPNAIVGTAYSQTIPLSGNGIITLTSTKPAWMTIAITGSNLNITGTPASGDVTTSTVNFSVTNNCGTQSLSQGITVYDSGSTCLEYMNDNLGRTAIGINCIYCNGDSGSNISLLQGNGFCIQSGNSGDFGYLRLLGPCSA